MHKRKLAIAAIFALLLAPRAAKASGDAGLISPSKHFAQEKLYTEENYVLNDYLEFSVFDMSQLELFVEGKKAELQTKPTGVIADTARSEAAETNVQAAPVAVESDVEKNIKGQLAEIPKLFFRNLKNQIYLQKIPVTLSAADSPAFARPLKLFIKLKKIALETATLDKKGNPIREAGAQIYGQIKDKKTDKVLMRFYDVETIVAEAAPEKTMAAIEVLAEKMMTDLGAFLKSKY